MKKHIFIPLAAALLLGLSACSGNTGESSSAPEPASSEIVANSVTIDNKEALQAEWYVAEGNRSLNISTDPATNVTQAFLDGSMVSTSSNTAVATVSNAVIIPIAAGTTTITVTYGGQSDSVDITIKELVIDQISSITAAEQVKRVRGIVTYSDSRDSVIDDGTGAILLYNQGNLTVGGSYDVSGTTDAYYGTLQFTAAATVEKIDDLDIATTISNPDVLDPATVDSKYKENTQGLLKPVSFWGTAFMSGTYKAVYVHDVDTTVLIEPMSRWEGEWNVGTTYDIKGYFSLYNSSNSYLPLYVTEATERIIEMTSFTLKTADGDNSVFVDGTKQLEVVPTPENASETDVTWASSDETIATVSAEGLVTGVKTGTVTITATHGEGETAISSSIELNVVTASTVTGLTLDQTEITGIHGAKTATIKATVAPETANQNVTWASSDETIATVSAEGVVTGVKAGTATITATTEGTGVDGQPLTATCSVTVESIPVGTAENPLDAEEWGTWINEDGGSNYGDETYIRGLVTSSAWYSNNSNYNLYLRSESGLTLEFYAAVVGEGSGITAGDDLFGKIVVCKGTSTVYKGTIELNKGCEIISATDYTPEVGTGAELLDFTEVFKAETGNKTLVTKDAPSYTIDAATSFNFTIDRGTASSDSQYNTYGHIRIYKNSTFTVAAKEEGKTISKIEFLFTQGNYGFIDTSTATSGSFTNSYTWVAGETAPSSVTINADQQVRLAYLIVTIA